jgi:hypothetical protein
MELPKETSKWATMPGFAYMQKSFAQGAFHMLKSFYGGNEKYRLVDSNGVVVDSWNTGELLHVI